jgi:hypothetical protein
MSQLLRRIRLMADEPTAPESPEAPITPDTSESVQSDRTLTQAEVDRIVESRLARERRKYEGFDEYREKAAAFDEAVQASKSELEQAQDIIAQLQEQNVELTDANSYVATRSALLMEAARSDRGIVDPEGAVEFLIGPDIDLLEFDEDGVPTNVEEALDALAEKRAYLVASSGPASSIDQGAYGGDANPGQLTEADLQNMSPREIVDARNEGRLDDLLSGR